MKKIALTIIIIIILIAAVAFVFWQRSQKVTPPVQTEVKDDTTSVIDKDLESVDVGDLDKEFEVIDNDLKNL